VIVVDGYIPPLSVAELKKLDENRQRATPEQLELAKRAWKAFGSADPASISKLLDENTAALPYLANALRRHLEEFPSSANGLSRSEREALTAIEDGHATPVAAFLEVARKQESIFLGDIVFYSYLERLSGKKDALVTWKDGSPVIAPTAERSREFVEGELVLTPLGREVLAGRKDWHGIHEGTRWLGGVEIKPAEAGWRWDPAERQLVRHGASKPAKPKDQSRSKAAAKPRSRAGAKKTKTRAAKKRSSPPAKKSKPSSSPKRSSRKRK
jgi:hypothetical protein